MKALRTTLNHDQLVAYTSTQLNTFYPDGQQGKVKEQLTAVIDVTMARMEKCFASVKTRYFVMEGRPFFNHLNGDHYSMFLYLLSNTIYKKLNDEDTAAKVFLLNKMMFGVDAFYRVELPEVFLFIHPIGTILGNARYGNYLVVYQGVTIGSKTDGVYPEFGERSILYSNASVLGSCKLGFNCVVGARSMLIDNKIGDNKVVVGMYPSNRITENTHNVIDYYFHLP